MNLFPRFGALTPAISAGQKIPQNGFLTCPPVRQIWEEAVQFLSNLLAADMTPHTPQHADLNLRNVVLGFPDLTHSTPVRRRQRIALWHSAVVCTTAKTRHIAISRAESV